MTDSDHRGAAEQVTTTVLTINAMAKHPGTVDPENAGSYAAALKDAREAFGGGVDELPAIGHLLAVTYDLAAFAAPRDPEPVGDLVKAFAQHLAERRS